MEAVREINRQREEAKKRAYEMLDQVKIAPDKSVKLWVCGKPTLELNDYRKGEERKKPPQPQDLTRVWRYKVIVLQNPDGTPNNTLKEVVFDVTSKKLFDDINRQLMKKDSQGNPTPQQKLLIERIGSSLGTTYHVEPC